MNEDLKFSKELQDWLAQLTANIKIKEFKILFGPLPLAQSLLYVTDAKYKEGTFSIFQQDIKSVDASLAFLDTILDAPLDWHMKMLEKIDDYKEDELPDPFYEILERYRKRVLMAMLRRNGGQVSVVKSFDKKKIEYTHSKQFM